MVDGKAIDGADALIPAASPTATDTANLPLMPMAPSHRVVTSPSVSTQSMGQTVSL
ncbi:hypothetical protein OK016_27540 [Vibrio chagasii]|nr:hypothetical protein [Vibrio chagasii]